MGLREVGGLNRGISAKNVLHVILNELMKIL